MGIMDGLNIASNAISVHSYRSHVAARNLSTVFGGGTTREVVDLAAVQGPGFQAELSRAAGGGSPVAASTPGMDAVTGGVRVQGTHHEGRPDDERAAALLDVSEMMAAKSAYEMNVRVATMLKSMAMSALEIGRGA